MKHKKPKWWIWLVVIGILLFVVFYVGGKSAICGTHIETYTSNVKNCDSIAGCDCLHKSWLGLGACDSCECTKEVSNC